MFALPFVLTAAPPQWWTDRGVLVPAAQANDFAAINQGQLKNLATAAATELDTNLPIGAGAAVHDLISGWPSPQAATNDYAAVNLGQLKAVAKPFYDQLILAGYTNQYPWAGHEAEANNYAAANIGQAKNLFNFSVASSIPGGIPDWWEMHYFGHTGVDPTGDDDHDGLTNLQEYQQGSDPNDFYNGQGPQVAIVEGDAQTGAPLGYLPVPLEVSVGNINGHGAANVRISLSVVSGGGLLQASSSSALVTTVSLTTNSDGVVRAFFQLPNTPNMTCQIAAQLVNSQVLPVTFTEQTDDGSGGMDYPSPFALNLSTELHEDCSVSMTWQNNLDGVTGFTISRSDNNQATWVQLGTTAADATTYTVPTEEVGIVGYSWYQVEATGAVMPGGSSTNQAGSGTDATPTPVKEPKQAPPPVRYAVIDLGKTEDKNFQAVSLNNKGSVLLQNVKNLTAGATLWKSGQFKNLNLPAKIAFAGHTLTTANFRMFDAYMDDSETVVTTLYVDEVYGADGRGLGVGSTGYVWSNGAVDGVFAQAPIGFRTLYDRTTNDPYQEQFLSGAMSGIDAVTGLALGECCWNFSEGIPPGTEHGMTIGDGATWNPSTASPIQTGTVAVVTGPPNNLPKFAGYWKNILMSNNGHVVSGQTNGALNEFGEAEQGEWDSYVDGVLISICNPNIYELIGDRIIALNSRGEFLAAPYNFGSEYSSVVKNGAIQPTSVIPPWMSAYALDAHDVVVDPDHEKRSCPQMLALDYRTQIMPQDLPISSLYEAEPVTGKYVDESMDALVGPASGWKNVTTFQINDSGVITAQATHVSTGTSDDITVGLHNLILLPVEIRDVKDWDDANDDVLIEPKKDATDTNIKSVAWIEPHKKVQDENPAAYDAGDDPRMPQLEVQFKGLPAAVKVQWKFKCKYSRPSGRELPEDEVKFPADGSFKEVAGDQPWKIHQEYNDKPFFGGDVELTYKIIGADGTVMLPEKTDKFRIAGKNPDNDRCRKYIDKVAADLLPQTTTLMWYAYAIAKHETRGEGGDSDLYYNHFLAKGMKYPRKKQNGESDTDYNKNKWDGGKGREGVPNWNFDDVGKPGGYGVMQVTGWLGNGNANVPRDVIWNWMKNVDGGMDELRRDHHGPAIRWMQTQRARANKPLPTHTVAGILFADGTPRTMEALVAIKSYNGNSVRKAPDTYSDPAGTGGFSFVNETPNEKYPNGYYCYWDQARSKWSLCRWRAKPEGIYVQLVCEEIDN